MASKLIPTYKYERFIPTKLNYKGISNATMPDKYEEHAKMMFSALFNNWLSGCCWSKAVWMSAYRLAHENGHTKKSLYESLRRHGMLATRKMFNAYITDDLSPIAFQKFNSYMIPLIIRVLDIQPEELYIRVIPKEKELRAILEDIIIDNYFPTADSKYWQSDSFLRHCYKVAILFYIPARKKAYAKMILETNPDGLFTGKLSKTASAKSRLKVIANKSNQRGLMAD